MENLIYPQVLKSVNSGQRAVVVLSGGQDSTTCLGLAIKHHGKENVRALSFYYGQKHHVELQCAASIARDAGIQHATIDVTVLGSLVKSALLDSSLDVNSKHERLENLPATFVPVRNALFLTLAHAMAQETDSSYIYTGVCETDYSGYPDCRRSFIDALEIALNRGYQSNIQIITPLMYLSKCDTFKLAQECAFLSIVINDTHTCYNGDHETPHAWGYGCGACPACELRKAGFEEFCNG